MNTLAYPWLRCYTVAMQLVVLVVVAIIVAFVAVDGIARMEARRPPPRDPETVSTQKIIVDLTKRR